MPNPPALGQQELETLRFIADHGPISVGEVARRFGEARGLARSTILTVMERLRKKGYLSRLKAEGSYQYESRWPKSEILRGLVERFVENSLEGSLSPFVAYLADARGLSGAEIEELKRIVDEMTPKKEEDTK
jgi:predicted transcriptional regulator